MPILQVYFIHVLLIYRDDYCCVLIPDMYTTHVLIYLDYSGYSSHPFSMYNPGRGCFNILRYYPGRRYFSILRYYSGREYFDIRLSSLYISLVVFT